MKHTPFFHQQLAAGASMREAQGWEMPDEYGDARAEHLAVRNSAGLFDWSSTGEIEIQGLDALPLVQKVIVNDAACLEEGRVLYSTMCQEDGSIFSDITVYRFPDNRRGERRFWIMTAWGSDRSNARPEFEWLLEQAHGLDVSVTDVSSGVALLAIQGPCAREIVAPLTPADLGTLPYMYFAASSVAGVPRALISRTGYTGELGYELVFPAEHAHEVWDAVTTAGQGYGLRLAGLQTAFSLRMEKGYIARFDILDRVTPLEAGLGWTVKFGKGQFVGRRALWQQAQEGARRRLVSVAMDDDLLPPGGCAILKDGKAVGKITSSAYGHAVGRPLALGLVPAELAAPGTQIAVEAAGQHHPAQVVRRPFYDAEGKRIRA